MSNEPGLTLGRLIAAERNARSAVNAVKNLMPQVGDHKMRVQALEAEVISLRQELAMLKARVFSGIGGGPTSQG